MDFVTNLSHVRQIAKQKLESHVLNSFRSNDQTACTIVENFFRDNNAMHLFRPHVGPSDKPLARQFSSLDMEGKKSIMNDFHFSKTYTEKSSFKNVLKEMSFVYATDFCRKYTEDYVCITSDFRPKLLRNFTCHMCPNWKEDGDAQNRVMDQLEFFKAFKFAREEHNIRMELNRFVKDGSIDPEIICSNPGSCDYVADTLIVDHIENYMTMEQVLMSMLQHKSSRALGYFLLPDGIDYKKKGSFYDGRMFFDRSTNSIKNVEEPVIFYDNEKGFSECVYPWKEYQKFVKTTMIVHQNKVYRYEIVNRTHGVAFYSMTFDGDYSPTLEVPTYQLSHYVDCYEVSFYRPEHNVFGKDFDRYVKKTAFVPAIIYAKTFEFALTVGPKDFNRKEIHERLCASFMRVQNTATGTITQFDPGLDIETIDIAADAIWTVVFLKRRQNMEVLASQNWINKEFGNVGLNFDTLQKYVNILAEKNNPLVTLKNMYDANKNFIMKNFPNICLVVFIMINLQYLEVS